MSRDEFRIRLRMLMGQIDEVQSRIALNIRKGKPAVADQLGKDLASLCSEVSHYERLFTRRLAAA